MHERTERMEWVELNSRIVLELSAYLLAHSSVSLACAENMCSTKLKQLQESEWEKLTAETEKKNEREITELGKSKHNGNFADKIGEFHVRPLFYDCRKSSCEPFFFLVSNSIKTNNRLFEFFFFSCQLSISRSNSPMIFFPLVHLYRNLAKIFIVHCVAIAVSIVDC